VAHYGILIDDFRIDVQRLDVPEFHDDVVNHYGRFDEEFLVVGIHLPVRMLL